MSAIPATSPGGGHDERSISAVSVMPVSASSTRPRPRPTWRHSVAGCCVASGSRRRCHMGTDRPALSSPRRAIRANGATRLFRPKYSPDRAAVCQAETRATSRRRTHPRRLSAPPLHTVTAAEYANYLANAGYARSQFHPALVHSSGCSTRGRDNDAGSGRRVVTSKCSKKKPPQSRGGVSWIGRRSK